MLKITQKILLLVLVAGLCVFVGSAGVQSSFAYETNLVVNNDDDVEDWENVVGVVDINNCPCEEDPVYDCLCINVGTENNRFIKKLAIYISNNDDFSGILDQKDQPKLKYFPDDLVREFKSPVTYYPFNINPDNFGITLCGSDSNLYIVVGVELNGIEGMVFAENGGTFDRYEGEEVPIWGYYVTYPLGDCSTLVE